VDWNPSHWVSDGREFLLEVRQEFRKVTWPSQREYVGGTIGVVVIVSIVTLVLGVVDFALGHLLQWVVP
jgi:preprotein translocase subunit SecE